MGSTGYPGETAGDDEVERCSAVDILFVIDNSGSMADEQAALARSVPGFISSIEESLQRSFDYHIGVVSTDESSFNAPGCRRLGALLTRRPDERFGARLCGPYAQGEAYLSREDNLHEAFSCVARVGTDGSPNERPIEAAAAALAPVGQATGLCNRGFLREHALLVLVTISDEDDAGASPGDPGDWYDDLVAVKGGRLDDIVVLSLVGQFPPNACAEPTDDGLGGAQPAPRLVEFTERFPHGVIGDVCAADYAPAFRRAVESIATACLGSLG